MAKPLPQESKMNTAQTISSGSKQLNKATISTLNPKEKLNENPNKSPSAQLNGTKQSQKTDKLASLKNPEKVDPNGKKTGEDTPEIDAYMKMISRLENKVKQDQFEKTDLVKLFTALEDKILSLKEHQKNRLKDLDFFKKNGIDNLKTLKANLTNMFDDNLERDGVLEFLKSPELVTILLKEQNGQNAYSPQLNKSKQSNTNVQNNVNSSVQNSQNPSKHNNVRV
ncbi:MAG: hypothetical protein GY866_05540 [Proteobacteria bacterium]|nr:hypothetical protein [Pseudomonadota bacterium]